jgi:RNA polymerase sigma factor (sigma-70 family)
MFFQSNKCTDLDDLVIEVFYRVAAKLRSEEILDLVPYCVAFAKNIVSEVQKKTWRLSSLDDLPVEGAGLADLHDHEEEIVDKIDRERMIACVRRCIAALRPDEQKLVIEYYDTYKGEQIDWRKKLAKNAGLTMETLRTRMNRLRERIEPLVKQCRKSPRQVLVSSRIGS